MELTCYYDNLTDSTTIYQQIDYTEFGNEQRLREDSIAFAYAEENDLYLCGTSMIPNDKYFQTLTISEFDSIITYWNTVNPQ